jgi:integrase
MGRRATGQILTSKDRRGGTTYSVRFRGSGYPQQVITLGSSRDGWTRSKAEHEAQIVAAQIRAGTWMPTPKPAYFDDGEPYTFRHLASDYYYRKRRKGLRATSLTDMLNKLQAHLLPFFGEYRLDQIDEQLVEDYIERKQRENDRIRAAESIGRPYRDKRGRSLRPLKPSTINTHLHLLAGILDRAVREGLIPRNPARGEDLRLAVRRERRYGLELDEAWSLIEAAGGVDRQPTETDELRTQIIELRDEGLDWKTVAKRVGRSPTTCMYHAQRPDPRPVPLRRAVVATLTLAGLRVGELCALNCAHVDLAHRVIRVIDAKTPAGVRTVDIHDDLLDELAAYKQALGARWQSTKPVFPNRRGSRLDRHAIARHVIAPSVTRADQLRAEQGLPPIGQHVTPHTLRYTYIASMFAAGADQEYVAAQVGHEDITTTNRIYRYVLRRKVRGEIGERRRQLLTAPLKPSDAALNVLLDDAETASERPNKGR